MKWQSWTSRVALIAATGCAVGILGSTADAHAVKGAATSVVHCPQAAKLSTAAGRKLKFFAKGTLTKKVFGCSYANVTGKGAGQVSLLVVYATGGKGHTVSQFYADIRKGAAEKHARAVKVKHLGEAAMRFTNHDGKSNPDGIATTFVAVMLAPRTEDLISAALPERSAVAIARTVVGTAK